MKKKHTEVDRLRFNNVRTGTKPRGTICVKCVTVDTGVTMTRSDVELNFVVAKIIMSLPTLQYLNWPIKGGRTIANYKPKSREAGGLTCKIQEYCSYRPP